MATEIKKKTQNLGRTGLTHFQHLQVCEAAFCRKPYLEVHMRTHTGN